MFTFKKGLLLFPKHLNYSISTLSEGKYYKQITQRSQRLCGGKTNSLFCHSGISVDVMIVLSDSIYSPASSGKRTKQRDAIFP